MRTQVPRWLAATLLCFAIAVTVSSPALAAIGPNGKIAYVVNMGFPDYTSDIWVMDADGSNQTNITNTPAVSEYAPIWSPDGTKIAYVVGENYISGVWVMNADGTGQFKLSTFTGWEFGPTWSGDSSQIALVRYVPGIVMSVQFDIFVVALDGSSDVNITNSDYDEIEPAWSPDGRENRLRRRSRRRSLYYVADRDGESRRIGRGRTGRHGRRKPQPGMVAGQHDDYVHVAVQQSLLRELAGLGDE